MKTLIDSYFIALKALVVICLVGITCLIFTNVVLRYGFNSGLFFSEEISRLAFVWLVFAGAQLMLHENGHIGVDILTRRVSAPVARCLLALTQVLMLYVTWLFLDGSWKQTIINLHVGAPSTGVSMALFYGAGLVFSICSAVLICIQLVRNLTGTLATPVSDQSPSPEHGAVE